MESPSNGSYKRRGLSGQKKEKVSTQLSYPGGIAVYHSTVFLVCFLTRREKALAGL